VVDYLCGKFGDCSFGHFGLAARLCPNPLGDLERSPDPLAAIWGLLLRGGDRRGEEEGEGGKGRQTDKYTQTDMDEHYTPATWTKAQVAE